MKTVANFCDNKWFLDGKYCTEQRSFYISINTRNHNGIRDRLHTSYNIINLLSCEDWFRLEFEAHWQRNRQELV